MAKSEMILSHLLEPSTVPEGDLRNIDNQDPIGGDCIKVDDNRHSQRNVDVSKEDSLIRKSYRTVPICDILDVQEIQVSPIEVRGIVKYHIYNDKIRTRAQG